MTNFTSFILDNAFILLVFGCIAGFAVLAKIIMALVSYNDNRAYEDYDRLNEDIYRHTQTLNDLRRQIADEQDRLVRIQTQALQPELEEALNIYEASNIRIPSDIIEDASIHYFRTTKQSLSFIESQRQAWKQENMKKVYKGDL